MKKKNIIFVVGMVVIFVINMVIAVEVDGNLTLESMESSLMETDNIESFEVKKDRSGLLSYTYDVKVRSNGKEGHAIIERSLGQPRNFDFHFGIDGQEA